MNKKCSQGCYSLTGSSWHLVFYWKPVEHKKGKPHLDTCVLEMQVFSQKISWVKDTVLSFPYQFLSVTKSNLTRACRCEDFGILLCRFCEQKKNQMIIEHNVRSPTFLQLSKIHIKDLISERPFFLLSKNISFAKNLVSFQLLQGWIMWVQLPTRLVCLE